MYIRWQREDYSTPLLRDGLSHVHRTAAGRIADIISVTWRRIHVTAPVPHLVVDIQYMTLPQLMLVIFKQTWHAKNENAKEIWQNIFSVLPLRADPRSIFSYDILISYSSKRNYLPNLNLLASAVGEVQKGPENFGVLPSTRPMPICFLLGCFWQARLFPKAKLWTKFTSFDSCRNNQEKVPNLGVFVHSYYSNSWDFRHPSKAK